MKRNNIFLLEIESNKTVSDLKKVIKMEKSPKFDSIPADELVLFRVSIPITEDNANFKNAIASLNLEDDASLLPAYELSELFSDTLRKHVHVVIKGMSISVSFSPTYAKYHFSAELVHPPVTEPEDQEVIEITKRTHAHSSVHLQLINFYHPGLDKIAMHILRSQPPSKSAKSIGYLDYQGGEEPIYDGRYPHRLPIDTRAPPIQLYNPVFGQFLDDIKNEKLEAPIEIIRATASFMHRASAIYEKEVDGASNIDELLNEVIYHSFGKVTSIDKTSPDGIIRTKVLVDGQTKFAALCIREDKNEIGAGGSDPSIQVGLSYGRFWAQDAVCAFTSFFNDVPSSRPLP